MTTLNAFEEQASAEAERTQDRTPDTAPALSGGLTLPVLALAALVASPAIYQCLVTHTVPMQVMLQRYVLIALGCLLVSEVVRRMIRPSTPAVPPTPSTGAATTADAAGDPALEDTLPD